MNKQEEIISPCIDCDNRWEMWKGYARDACDDVCKKYKKYHKQKYGYVRVQPWWKKVRGYNTQKRQECIENINN